MTHQTLSCLWGEVNFPSVALRLLPAEQTSPCYREAATASPCKMHQKLKAVQLMRKASTSKKACQGGGALPSPLPAADVTVGPSVLPEVPRVMTIPGKEQKGQ